MRFSVKVGLWVDGWGDRHAVSDQLMRAAGSVVENIAFASASYTGEKIKYIEYAIGSALECAACLDVACTKRLMIDSSCINEKRELSRHVGMLVALRRSWLKPSPVVNEDPPEYDTRQEVLFQHEKLDVYQTSLEVVRGLTSFRELAGIATTAFRRIDEPATSMVLNIAEGNGRFLDSEKRRFFEISLESAIKLAARLDVYSARGTISIEDTHNCKALIERVASMLSVMIDRPRKEYSTKLTSGLTSEFVARC